MVIGFLSAILDGWSFEEVAAVARKNGYKCIEVACWPAGEAERRYAGVSHIDVDHLTDDVCRSILTCCKENGVDISALAYYPNTMDSDLKKRAHNIEHLKKVIMAAEKLGVKTVTTFIGRDQNKSLEDNLKIFEEIWPDIISFSEEHSVKIAIENCPMLFSADEWPGGKNLAYSPEIWREMFRIIPSRNFGLNYDPSHFVWQMMDYIKPLYEFKDRIFHVHFKDIKLYSDKLDRVGVLSYPLSYMKPKLPGLGDINWGKFISALTDIEYDGYACVEIEDKAFEGSRENILKSLALTRKYLGQFIE